MACTVRSFTVFLITLGLDVRMTRFQLHWKANLKSLLYICLTCSNSKYSRSYDLSSERVSRPFRVFAPSSFLHLVCSPPRPEHIQSLAHLILQAPISINHLKLAQKCISFIQNMKSFQNIKMERNNLNKDKTSSNMRTQTTKSRAK